MRALAIFCLARVSRLDIVCSGTSSARPTSAVDSPHSVCSASATCVSTASAGWQQVNTSRSWSSRSTSGGSSGGPARGMASASFPGTGGLAAGDVDRAVARGERQPGPRLRRDTRARPGVQRPQDGVLHGVLGELQVAGVPDERGQHAPALVAHEADEGGARGDVTAGRRRLLGHAWVVGHPNSITGRTSTAPCHAPGIFAAVATASSRSAHSSR